MILTIFVRFPGNLTYKMSKPPFGCAQDRLGFDLDLEDGIYDSSAQDEMWSAMLRAVMVCSSVICYYQYT